MYIMANKKLINTVNENVVAVINCFLILSSMNFSF